MDVMDYCKNMEIELTGWKAKLFDAMNKIDKLPTGSKEKMFPQIEELKMIVSDLEDRVTKLKTECPSEWSPVQKEVDDKVDTLRGKYGEVLKVMSLGDMGGQFYQVLFGTYNNIQPVTLFYVKAFINSYGWKKNNPGRHNSLKAYDNLGCFMISV